MRRSAGSRYSGVSVKVENEGMERMKATAQPDYFLKPPMERFKLEVNDLLGTIKRTAPVDTGTYRRGWHRRYVENTLERVVAYIENPVEYAYWLIHGTRRNKNAKRDYARADLSRGIIHDVRAIIFEWNQGLKERIFSRRSE